LVWRERRPRTIMNTCLLIHKLRANIHTTAVLLLALSTASTMGQTPPPSATAFDDHQIEK
jgi:hypothetical protein